MTDSMATTKTSDNHNLVSPQFHRRVGVTAAQVFDQVTVTNRELETDDMRRRARIMTGGDKFGVQELKEAISCVRCGQPWDALGVFEALTDEGDMTMDGAKRFLAGVNCPNCETERFLFR